MKLRKINILLQPTYLQAARDLNSLQSRGITAVVNCTTNISCYHLGTLGSTVGPIKLWKRRTNFKQSYEMLRLSVIKHFLPHILIIEKIKGIFEYSTVILQCTLTHFTEKVYFQAIYWYNCLLYRKYI